MKNELIYSIDFESRSHIDLVEQGLDIYANDPTTEVLCIAFGTTPQNVKVTVPRPTANLDLNDLLAHVRNGGKIQAWNAGFEYAIWNCVCVPKYGWPPLKLEQCIDSMAIAAANNIPQSLDEAGAFINAAYQKDPIGKRLIQKLCKPHKGEFNNDPELMAQLFEYCRKDVLAEMSIVSSLRPLSDQEQAIWILTQRINNHGVPVCPNELQNAVKAVVSAQNKLDEECIQLTGHKPSERAKLLSWLNNRGANLADLTAETVSAVLQRSNLDPAIRRALELRQEGSMTSTAKYQKMLEIQRDGKIRNTLVYHGASTGRWASRGGLNLQNIARPTLDDEQIEAAIPRVFDQGSGSMQELSSLVRSAIKAPNGFTFVDVDFSSIENRVGVWIANQQDKLELFRQGLDEYKTFASESLYRVPYDEVTKDQRQISKSAVLGAMFGQGAKGLVKYAEGMGVTLTEQEAQSAVNAYRASYARVKACWASMEQAAMSAIKNPGQAYPAGRVLFKVGKGALYMQLPSKRLICWQSPELENQLTPWGATKLGITVRSQSTFTRQWGRNKLIGSSIFQSSVQGCARDFLAEASLRLHDKGYNVINLIHDECLLLVEEQSAESALEDVMNIMTTPPTWAPDFPLAAEGWIAKRYKK